MASTVPLSARLNRPGRCRSVRRGQARDRLFDVGAAIAVPQHQKPLRSLRLEHGDEKPHLRLLGFLDRGLGDLDGICRAALGERLVGLVHQGAEFGADFGVTRQPPAVGAPGQLRGYDGFAHETKLSSKGDAAPLVLGYPLQELAHLRSEHLGLLRYQGPEVFLGVEADQVLKKRAIGDLVRRRIGAVDAPVHRVMDSRPSSGRGFIRPSSFCVAWDRSTLPTSEDWASGRADAYPNTVGR